MTSNRNMSHAVHEAGHAVMRWALGYHTDAIRLLSEKQFRQGRRLHDRRGRIVDDAIGHCDGHGVGCTDMEAMLLASPGTSEQVRPFYLKRFYQGLRVDCAGYVAEARFRGIETSEAIEDGGREDYAGMLEVACAFVPHVLPEGTKDVPFAAAFLIHDEQQYAERLFDAPGVWGGVLKIAKGLADTGEVLGDAIIEIMNQETGASFKNGREFLA
jgi:hypothetical protein